MFQETGDDPQLFYTYQFGGWGGGVETMTRKKKNLYQDRLLVSP